MTLLLDELDKPLESRDHWWHWFVAAVPLVLVCLTVVAANQLFLYLPHGCFITVTYVADNAADFAAMHVFPEVSTDAWCDQLPHSTRHTLPCMILITDVRR